MRMTTTTKEIVHHNQRKEKRTMAETQDLRLKALITEMSTLLDLPLEAAQETVNSFTVRDSGGDIICEYASQEDELEDLAKKRIELIVGIVNHVFSKIEKSKPRPPKKRLR
jgi:hypothetical protein